MLNTLYVNDNLLGLAEFLTVQIYDMYKYIYLHKTALKGAFVNTYKKFWNLEMSS